VSVVRPGSILSTRCSFLVCGCWTTLFTRVFAYSAYSPASARPAQKTSRQHLNMYNGQSHLDVAGWGSHPKLRAIAVFSGIQSCNPRKRNLANATFVNAHTLTAGIGSDQRRGPIDGAIHARHNQVRAL
jgi:hypothetical protein